jgi:hypothetical protein
MRKVQVLGFDFGMYATMKEYQTMVFEYRGKRYNVEIKNGKVNYFSMYSGNKPDGRRSALRNNDEVVERLQELLNGYTQEEINKSIVDRANDELVQWQEKLENNKQWIAQYPDVNANNYKEKLDSKVVYAWTSTYLTISRLETTIEELENKIENFLA